MNNPLISIVTVRRNLPHKGGLLCYGAFRYAFIFWSRWASFLLKL